VSDPNSPGAPPTISTEHRSVLERRLRAAPEAVPKLAWVALTGEDGGSIIVQMAPTDVAL
jgi:hypothetical protein